MDRRAGFTLIELMIVVAIIGILAAIAIPNFLTFQMRSRAGEGKTNLAALRVAQEGYMGEYGSYVAAAILPIATAALTSDKNNWPVPAASFDTVGWAPEGEVYFSYQVSTGPAGCPAPGAPCTAYTAEAASDIDDDNVINWWGYVKLSNGGVGIAGSSCPVTGVWNPIALANDLLETVGPCGAAMGQGIF